MLKASALYRFLAIAFCFVGCTHYPEAKDVRGFLKEYCFECHDTLMEEGDREFETFQLPLKTESDLITAREMIDQVTLKEMPPQKAAQPSDEERLEFIKTLRHERRKARTQFQSTGDRTIMRRLSTREYENTLETLFGRRIDTLGLTVGFPQEDPSHHIDTIGQSQITSGFFVGSILSGCRSIGRIAAEQARYRTSNLALRWQFQTIRGIEWLPSSGI